MFNLNPEGRQRLIIDLNTIEPDQGSMFIRRIGNEVGGYKVDVELIPMVQALAKYAVIFCDEKFYHAPVQMAVRVRRIVDAGCDMFTVAAAIGEKSIAAAVANKGRAKLILSTVLTTQDKPQLEQLGFSSNLTITDIVVRQAQLAASLGCDGITCSGYELEALNSVPELQKLIKVTPGCRMLGFPSNEHQRAMAPKELILKKTTFVIAGRPVNQLPNPTDLIKAYVQEIKEAEMSAFKSAVAHV